MKNKRISANGFTLIELMVVVVVIALLAAIALPSYQDSIRKGKRAAAKSVLSDLANRQQAYLLDKRSYATSLTALVPGFAAPAEISVDFQFAVSADNGTSPPSFSVTALPISSIMLADQCGTSATVPLALTESGARTPAACWR